MKKNSQSTASRSSATTATAAGSRDFVVVRFTVRLSLEFVERRATKGLLALGANEVLK